MIRFDRDRLYDNNSQTFDSICNLWTRTATANSRTRHKNTFTNKKPIRNRSNDNRVKVTQSRRRLISSLKAALKRPATLWWRWRFCAQKSRTQILKQECRRQIVNSKIKCPTGIHVTGIWRRRDASVRRRYVEDFRSSSVNWEMKQIVIGFLFFCEMVWCGFSWIRCSYDDCFGNWIL